MFFNLTSEEKEKGLDTLNHQEFFALFDFVQLNTDISASADVL